MNSKNLKLTKKNVAVIFGGNSPEYSVSLQSAYSVITNIDTDMYNPLLIGISKAGEWFLFFAKPEKLLDDSWCNNKDCIPLIISPDPTVHGGYLIKENSLEKLFIDIALPILHGKNGEDGTVQGLLELACIPFAGCRTLSSALCMDKYRSHKLIESCKIPVAESFIVDKFTPVAVAMEKARELSYPLFIKPLRAGSSFGITRLCEEAAFAAALELAFAYDDWVIIEKEISGFEVGCAILGNDILTVGEIDEIEISTDFFDFTEKYTLQSSKIHLPARVDASTALKIKELAKKIYRALDCSGFARVDMFITNDGEIFFNEINTIPGFTSHSRFPNMLKASGMSFSDIISKIILCAV